MRKRYNLSFRREQQKKERIRRAIIIVVVLFIFAVLGTLIYFAWNAIDWNSIGKDTNKKKAADKDKSQKVELTINSVGEVNCYNSQLRAAYNDGKYDFTNSFENVSKYIKDGDLSLFDLESTLAGEPYSGYPKFNAPDELATALKAAGFDVAVTANEHALDRDADGVKATIDSLDKAGLEAAGTKKDKRDKDYLITTVGGIKVGVVAYTQETSTSDSYRTLGGSSMTEDEAALINSYSPSLGDEDMERVKTSMDNARNDGAEIVICYFHWGDDYDTGYNEREKAIAEKLVDMGADMIFGAHPNVVQNIETIKNDSGQKIPVFYSLGNFFSGQRNATIGTKRVEEGIIAQVKITYDKEAKKITDIKYSYIPTWTDNYWDNDISSNVFTVLPLNEDIENNAVLQKSGHQSNAEEALQYLIEMLGDPDGSHSKDKSATEGAVEE